MHRRVLVTIATLCVRRIEPSRSARLATPGPDDPEVATREHSAPGAGTAEGAGGQGVLGVDLVSRAQNHFFLVHKYAQTKCSKMKEVDTASAPRYLPQHS